MIKQIPKVTKLLWKLRKKYYARRYKYKKKVSIISQNCIGGLVYSLYSVEFLSPFINMFILCEDYIKIASNLQYYVSLEVEPSDEKPIPEGATYPVCKLGDCVLYCVHYKNYEEVREKWNRRKERINYDNLLFVMTDRDGFDEKFMPEFEKLEGAKVLFSSKEYESKYPWVLYMPEFKDLQEVGPITGFSSPLGKRYFEKFDFKKYLISNQRI